MNILAWIVVGLVAGIIANVIYPGKAKGGALGAIMLGIIGGVIGGWIVGAFTGDDVMTGFNFTSILVATLGALLLVFGYNAIRGGSKEPAGRF